MSYRKAVIAAMARIVALCVLLIVWASGAQAANLNATIAGVREHFAKGNCVFDYYPLADGTPRWLGDFGKRTTVELYGKTQLLKASMVTFFDPGNIKEEIVGPILEVALAVAICMPRSVPDKVVETVGLLFRKAIIEGGKAQLKHDGIPLTGEVKVMNEAAAMFLVTVNQ